MATACGGELHLVGRLDPLEAPLDCDAEARAVPDSVAAELGPHARLAGAERLRISVARRHAEVLPDLRELLLCDAEQVDALAAGDLHHRHLVLVGHVRDASQLGRGGDATVDPRDDAEGAVFLDVRVDAVVDEAGVALVLVVIRPERLQEGGETDLAPGILLPSPQRREHGGDALEAPLPDGPDEIGLRQRHAGHVVVHGRVLGERSPRRRLQHCLHERLARAAPGGGARRVAYRLQGAATPPHRAHDAALGHPVAVADLRVLGQGGRVHRPAPAGPREEEVRAVFRERHRAVEELQE
jgi:hypothetical protein